MSDFLIRRRLLRGLFAPLPAGVGLAALGRPVDATADYPAVLTGTPLTFPRDFGSHPDYRTEWWYLTAWLETPLGSMGLQLTFFRSRTPFGRQNPSRLAARQLYFAHAAIAVPANGKLIHAEQAWRGAAHTARSSEVDTDIQIGRPNRRWTLQRQANDHYLASVRDPLFDLQLQATPANAQPIRQGDAGFSLKGALPRQASYYYSRPQLDLHGSLTQKHGHNRKEAPATIAFTGKGWLDHEWSSELLDPRAQGWDWIGINFSDGRALMAFQMRTRNGGLLRSTARLINPDGSHEDLPVRFSALKHWRSPRTNTKYPVSMRVQAGALDLRLEPLMPDQELDSRRSTGTIYWEGAVVVSAYSEKTNPGQSVIGRGYLELTGYSGKITL
ncbi:MAG: lipocalin-like domain-containing protein [Burkholderiaceae bacterium]